ncbi:MAG: hypothetical protein EOM67_17135 [Spirochaetia bacterium]|nr:hypothetical protein [Spirochaetia bacterium]
MLSVDTSPLLSNDSRGKSIEIAKSVVDLIKSTIGAILEDIQTEDGERIDYTFSNKSVLARITNSGYTLGIIGNMMKEITKRAVIAYRK